MSGADSVVVVQGDAEQMPAPSSGAQPSPIEVVIDDAPKMKLPENWPANATLLQDGTVNLSLEKPVQFKHKEADGSLRDGDYYPNLHLQRLTGKHKQKQFDAKNAYELEILMFGTSARLDEGRARLLYEAMDQADIAAVTRVIRFFTTPGQLTGPAI